MNRRNSIYPCTLFCALLLFAGCAPISKQLREQAKPLSFADVSKNPEAYKGEIVIWGGEIVQATNQRDRTFLIEVLQRPLDWEEEPQSTETSEGRFLVLVERFLNPLVYRKGEKITVAGTIIGERTQLLGEMEYQYPLLLSRQIYLWREYWPFSLPSYDWDHPYGEYPGWDDEPLNDEPWWWDQPY